MRKFSSILACAFLLDAPASAVTFDWVFVGDAGNAPDSAGNCYSANCGSVPYDYSISKYEVTNAQYAEFLNAKAVSDPLGLYHGSMGSDATFGGITRSGPLGSFTYAVKAGFANKPVTYVSFFDALRFANWLNNGQGSGDTETGAYTLLGGTETPSNYFSVARNDGANIFLPSENEWYKAAYYSPSGIYFDYATGTNGETGCVATDSDTGNSGNCFPYAYPTGSLTDVGAYRLSNSPYGTFDQGGNVKEWNEAVSAFESRGLRGGSWQNGAWPASSWRFTAYYDQTDDAGFRVVSLVAGPSPDADNDNVPDHSDNCPNDPNSRQEDADLDLIGDACDAFPMNPDNEKAQCFIDLEESNAALSQAQQNLGACQANCVGAATDCRDGIDNDRDERIDFPADSGCDSPDDATETPTPPPPPCGFGPELALVLPALWWLRCRRSPGVDSPPSGTGDPP